MLIELSDTTGRLLLNRRCARLIDFSVGTTYSERVITRCVRQHAVKALGVHYDHVIEALASDRADDAFRIRVLLTPTSCRVESTALVCRKVSLLQDSV